MTRQIALALVLGGALLLGGEQAMAITILHSFAAGNDDGKWPEAGVTLSGSKLYGTTTEGGDDNHGVVYSMNIDGSGFTLLHEFNDAMDGTRPTAEPTIDGSMIYGTTEINGGTASSKGTLYSMGTDGSDFTKLHTFVGGSDDGGIPVGRLVLSGSTLFGATRRGGDNDRGTVFSIETDGSEYTILHEFTSPNDGRAPFDGVTLSGGRLFGTTRWGGSSDLGTVYSINTDGSDYSILHEFSGEPNDGNTPFAGLVLGGSTLFGSTWDGGANGSGTIFSLNTDGTGYTLLHEFTPYGPNITARMLLSGSTLFAGGQAEYTDGILFSINTDGTGYKELFRFPSTSDLGSNPAEAEFVLLGSTVFATMIQGGENKFGTVYSFEIPEPSSFILVILGGLVGAAALTHRRLFR